MARLDIRTIGDPVLANRAELVTVFDAGLRRLVADMFETMYDAPGVGLAAPQIGVGKQIFVYDDDEGHKGVFVNPELVETDGEWHYEEGCLSVPGFFFDLARPHRVRMRGFDEHGRAIEVEGVDLLGRVLQHEYDHLQGMLLIERLPREQQAAVRKELRQRLINAGE